MSPGGYLLSRDLSSDYHRRANVSLPGSEWDRVGPSGYDHQGSRSLFAWRSLAVSGRSCVCCRSVVLLLVRQPCLHEAHADIRVAVVLGYFNFLRFELTRC